MHLSKSLNMIPCSKDQSDHKQAKSSWEEMNLG